VLGCRKELITPNLLMIVDKALKNAEQDFLSKVRKAMKSDHDVVTNNESTMITGPSNKVAHLLWT